MVLLELCWMQKQFPYIPFSMAAPALSIHAVPQPAQNRAVNELSPAEPGPAAITSLQRSASRSSPGWSRCTQGRQSCSPLEVTNDLTKSRGLAAHAGWCREPWGGWHHGCSGCLHHLFAVCSSRLLLGASLHLAGSSGHSIIICFCTFLTDSRCSLSFPLTFIPLVPMDRRHESPAMSGSQLGAATSTHCRRDEETGNTIPMNRGKAGKEPTLVGPCRGLKRQRVCSASKRQRVPQRVCSASVLGEAQNKACYCPCFRYAFVSYSEKLKPKWTWCFCFEAILVSALHSYTKTWGLLIKEH